MRITPAYAGKTHTGITCPSASTDSPPLTRERRKIMDKFNRSHRITPAYAGKTLMVAGRVIADKDHPRLRGKDYPQSRHFPTNLGSPPLTRERHIMPFITLKTAGITPAYAGKTLSHRLHLLQRQDHPRLRGKDLLATS